LRFIYLIISGSDITSRPKVVWQHANSFTHSSSVKSFDSEVNQDDKNCTMPLGKSTYIAIRHAFAQFQMLSFSSYGTHKFKIKMAAGGHPHFDNDHNVYRITCNPTQNYMMLVWHKSVKLF
jgi:hypothetical protein